MASSHEPESPPTSPVLPGRLERLRAELADEGVPALSGAPDELAGLVELAYALRPPIHERRVPTYGAILTASPDDDLSVATDRFDIAVVDLDVDSAMARRFADGLTTFAVRCPEAIRQLACFDQAMSSEYDLVRLHSAIGGLVVQRHPTGEVRVYGAAGVVRWNGVSWYHEAPVSDLLETLRLTAGHLPIDELRPLLQFAVHELSPRRIGATIVWRPTGEPPPPGRWESLYPRPPALRLSRHPGMAGAIAHVLAQTDGAAVFGRHSTLDALGVRLAPSTEAEASLAPVQGTRHTSALRYSYDDDNAVVIAVSDDGPVSIMHGGQEVTRTTEERIG